MDISTGSMEDSKISSAAYDALFRSQYDTRFTTDISNKMYMPDKLSAVNDFLNRPTKTLPDVSDTLSQHPEPSYYMVGTPPRVLTAADTAAAYSEDEEVDEEEQQIFINKKQSRPHLNFASQSTPQRKNSLESMCFDAAAVPMTPGTLLLHQRGDDMAVVRRQLGKLISHVRRLEEENARRQQREYLLYPLVLGFCAYQLAKYFLFGGRR